MATNEESLAGMAQIRDEVADGVPQDVSDDKSFVDDLGVDSLSMVGVSRDPVARDGARAPDGEVPSLNTVGDAESFLAKGPP